MAINFDLNDLLAFRAVAELSSFRKAAESVHLSQPAFSRRIDKLEQALGVRLLERTTRRVTLTAVGRDFERKVRELLDDLDATLLGIRGVAATRMGEVTVACIPSTVYYYLSHVIRRYHERSPKVRVKVLDASANEVLAAVSRGEADFGLNFMGAPGRRSRVQVVGRGTLRRRVPTRPSDGETAPRNVGPVVRLRLHFRRAYVRKSRPVRSGPCRGRQTATSDLRGAARDHHAWLGGSRTRCRGGAVDGDARTRPSSVGQRGAFGSGCHTQGRPDSTSRAFAIAGGSAAL